jgi:hypothetical protein
MGEQRLKELEEISPQEMEYFSINSVVEEPQAKPSPFKDNPFVKKESINSKGEKSIKSVEKSEKAVSKISESIKENPFVKRDTQKSIKEGSVKGESNVKKAERKNDKEDWG